MSDVRSNGPPARASGSDAAPSPVDSGSTSQQTQSGAAVSGELVPRPQFTRVADRVSDEVSGLVTIDPAAMGSLGALRVATSYMNEQAAATAALRRDVKEAQEREREAASKSADLRTMLAVATNINETEKKLRAPRAFVSMLGLTIASFGVDQFGNGSRALGVVLVAVGVLIVGATYLIAASEKS